MPSMGAMPPAHAMRMHARIMRKNSTNAWEENGEEGEDREGMAGRHVHVVVVHTYKGIEVRRRMVQVEWHGGAVVVAVQQAVQ